MQFRKMILTSARKFVLLVSITVAAACQSENDSSSAAAKQNAYVAPVRMMSDAEYPDLPDIGYRSDEYNKIAYDGVTFVRKGGMVFDIVITERANPAHKITLSNVDLTELIPSVPDWIRGDSYLELIGMVNSELGRHQIAFGRTMPTVKLEGNEFELKSASRVDVSNNCLFAGLWEIIAFSNEKGDDQPYYHGWFDFPKGLYKELFETKNGISYENYRSWLENYKEMPSKKVDLAMLRKEASSRQAVFATMNEQLYPLKGERQKKAKNIINPTDRPNISAMLNDTTTFATFAAPGFYDRRDPRKTQLSRFAKLQSVTVRNTADLNAAAGASTELDLQFSAPDGGKKTRLVVGGIKVKDLPVLDAADAHKGWQMPMGIGIHSFYETYEKSAAKPDKQSPYFGILLDDQGKWLDSHLVGTDGPLMFIDKSNPKLLHLYLLSFERHAFVGHFQIELE
jgi:hypothetical protein